MAKGGGGAWKVAYADFVTAMMALFMVLWIVAQDEEILLYTSQYFQNPFDAPFNDSSGIMPEANSMVKTPSNGDDLTSGNQQSTMFLQSLMEELRRVVNTEQFDAHEQPVDISIVSDGLRVIVYNRAQRPLFEEDSAVLTPWGEILLQNLAWVLDQHSFRVRVDAHSAKPHANTSGGADLWALTSARANTARRTLVKYALGRDKIDRLTGFADTRPLEDLAPEEPSNDRLEISLALD